MASRLTQRRKESTMLVTPRTLHQAMSEARQLVTRIGHDDPRSAELKQLYNEIGAIVRGEGAESNTEQYDDAVNPQGAAKLKQAVERIRQLKNEISRPAQAMPQAAPAMQPAFASAETKEGALMSSRLFARKKKKHVEAEDEMLDQAPEAVAGDAPAEPMLEEDGMDDAAGMAPGAAAAPAPAPVNTPTAGNPFANLPTELLSAWVEAATKVDNFSTNPAILGAIENVSEELKNRPMAPAADPNAPKQASAKTAAPKGWETVVAELKTAKIANGIALAHWMKEQGYSAARASFLIRRGKAASLVAAKLAAAPGVPPVNEDTMNKVDGQPHEVPEIAEAHGKTEGVAKAEAHDGHAAPKGDKVPSDLEKQASKEEKSKNSAALKTAEQLEKKLGELYLDAKPIVQANSSAAVVAAVESIYDAKNKFAEAKMVLNKHEMQANAEEEAQKTVQDKDKKDKKASLTVGLALAAAE